LSNTNTTNNLEWTQVLRNGKKFLPAPMVVWIVPLLLKIHWYEILLWKMNGIVTMTNGTYPWSSGRLYNFWSNDFHITTSNYWCITFLVNSNCPSFKATMQGNTSSGISYQLKDIYACGVAGMLLHSNGKFTMGK
jgi:hypothetical protein